MSKSVDFFSGVFPAALTPIKHDYRCDEEELARHCCDLMNRGCKGVVLFGTTGEGPSFSIEEREICLKKIFQLGLDPQRTILMINCCALQDAKRLARLADDYQCAAVLLAPPFFFRSVEEAGVVSFFREVIRGISSRVLLYHIPQYTGVPITLNMIRLLQAEFPEKIIGMKDSEGNITQVKDILREFPKFKIFIGNESQISEAVQLGAAGAISGVANAYPELISSLYDFGKDPLKSNKNQVIQRIIEIIQRYPIFPAIKCLVENQKGAAWHYLRPPLVPLTWEQKQQINLEITEKIMLSFLL